MMPKETNKVALKESPEQIIMKSALPAAGSRGHLSVPTGCRVRHVSAAARPSAPPAARAADSSPASSPSGSAHVTATVNVIVTNEQSIGAEMDGDEQ